MKIQEAVPQVFWSQSYNITTIHQQTRSDDSTYPSLLQATQLQSGDGQGIPIPHFSENRWGFLNTAFSACPLATHSILLRTVALSSDERRTREKCSRDCPPFANQASLVCCVSKASPSVKHCARTWKTSSYPATQVWQMATAHHTMKQSAWKWVSCWNTGSTKDWTKVHSLSNSPGSTGLTTLVRGKSFPLEKFVIIH